MLNVSRLRCVSLGASLWPADGADCGCASPV
jgi:hypothetical protein